MIKIDNTTKVWVTSDTHYNHKNICRGVTEWRTKDGQIPVGNTRDFRDLDEMNETMIESINSMVGQDDLLIHLGDWSFGGFDSIRKFRDRIYCQNIHLVLGNHDHHIENNRGNVQDLFNSVSHYKTLQYGKLTFKLMHYPISSWDGIHKGVIHLHGHCHLPTDKRFGKGRRMDVGMDGHPEFRPYNLKDEIIPMMMERDIFSEMDDDHHV